MEFRRYQKTQNLTKTHKFHSLIQRRQNLQKSATHNSTLLNTLLNYNISKKKE
jgi:hypothetical protein